MAVGEKEQISGVAAFIVLGKYPRVLTIEELQIKRSTNKIAGMRSIPMETIEPGETYEDALRRLLREEVKAGPIANNNLAGTELCTFQVVPNVWVHTFYMHASNLSINMGTEAREVANPKWEHFRDILDHELGSRKYRGGNREAVWSYLRLQRNQSLRPDIYDKVVDRVPAYVFDDIEAGREIPDYTFDEEIFSPNRNRELFPYPLDGLLWAGSPLLARL